MANKTWKRVQYPLSSEKHKSKLLWDSVCYGQVSKHSQHRKQRSGLDCECEAELSLKLQTLPNCHPATWMKPGFLIKVLSGIPLWGLMSQQAEREWGGLQLRLHRALTVLLSPFILGSGISKTGKGQDPLSKRDFQVTELLCASCIQRYSLSRKYIKVKTQKLSLWPF